MIVGKTHSIKSNNTDRQTDGRTTKEFFEVALLLRISKYFYAF